jgi:lysophospholipase L1-like esterase
MRLVCVGDSFTEGLWDDLRPDGECLGWADRVAQSLAPVEYANLAVRGKLLDQIVDDQVATAATLRPDIVTFHAGGNDVLRRSTDMQNLFQRYEQAVAGLPGRVVLFTCLTRAGGSGRFADLIAQRFSEFNDNVRAVSLRLGTDLVDLEAIEALTDRRFWHSDRLHLNPEGHKRVAAAVLDTLGQSSGDWWSQPLPPVSASRLRDAGRDALWVKEHFAPWIVRRLRGVSSGDGRQPKDTTLRLIAAPPTSAS